MQSGDKYGGNWWRLKYRCGGKEKRLALGVYPESGVGAGARQARRGAQAAGRWR
ncbi:integrase arm-type DNA-binding domain-containing protein [Luteimonas aquatica]|uniref:integrase arm-type DNA-binding domain-containing protein n=1 Tax=Luteimonas aquatica TaxID=450364 RepID=UPI0030DA9935